ncbi:MAG: mandelate racemase/muconate lactonizing enzyme family protein [Microcella sp.]
MARIDSIRLRWLRGELGRPWATDVTGNHVIVVDVMLDDGTAGTGFSWTPHVGASAVHVFLRDELVPRALGRSADPESLWVALWEEVHEAGGGGITSIALAGIDIALWDARARSAGRPLADEIGLHRDEVAAYGSGINLHYSTDELIAQSRRFVEAGNRAVKIKVGRPSLDDDAARVAAVREAIGPDVALRVDANQRWRLEQAIIAAHALAEYDIDWLEEPLRADDSLGHRELARHSPIPLAVGENLHTVHRFAELIASGTVGVAQPNVVRVGGITPFLQIARIAADAGVRLAPHLLPELSVPLALAVPAVESVEAVEGASLAELDVLAADSPVSIGAGVARSTAPAGLGLTFRPATDRDPREGLA